MGSGLEADREGALFAHYAFLMGNASLALRGHPDPLYVESAREAGLFLDNVVKCWTDLQNPKFSGEMPAIRLAGVEGFLFLQRRLGLFPFENEGDLPRARAYMDRAEAAAKAMKNYGGGRYPEAATFCSEIADKCAGIYIMTPDPDILNDD